MNTHADAETHISSGRPPHLTPRLMHTLEDASGPWRSRSVAAPHTFFFSLVFGRLLGATSRDRELSASHEKGSVEFHGRSTAAGGRPR
jgi:hypothetical protein